jgi:predicted transcriptional regulator
MATEAAGRVKLTETDFLILDKLQEGRNMAGNIALEIDRARKYVNQRMPYLLDYGLVEKIGPMEDSGLYELTPKGQVAVEHREKYHDDSVDFDGFLDERLGDS